MRRLCAWMLLLTLWICPAALGENAAPKPLTNRDGFVYIVLDNGEARIVGYAGKGGAITVPAKLDGHPVSEIGNTAFAHARITKATVSEGIRSIGPGAFEHCLELTEVRLPEGLQMLNTYVFHDCHKLKRINLPGTLTFIGDGIFKGCPVLETVELAADHPVLAMVDGVLFQQAAKRLLWYPPQREGETYAVPEGTLAIGGDAFSFGNRLTVISVPDSVEEIGWYAFFACRYLEEVNIPAKVTALTSVFPTTETLRRITVSPDNPVYEDRDGVLFQRETRELVFYPPGREGETYEIPEGTRAIANTAFRSSKLTQIVMPDSLRVIGSNAFMDCTALTSVTVPEGVEEMQSLAFQGCEHLEEVRLPRSLVHVVSNPFRRCFSLTRVILDEDHPALALMDGALVSLADMQLLWYPSSGPEKVTIPAGVRIIGGNALSACPQLTEVILPEGVVEIGISAFSDDKALRRIHLPESLTVIDRLAFSIGRDAEAPITYVVKKGSYAENFCQTYHLKIEYAR